MKKFTIFLSLLLLISCNSQDKKPIKGKTAFQQKQNAQFKDASKSPLTKEDLKTFDQLDFYAIDTAFTTVANLERTPNDPIFEMPTTTDRKPLYRRYGILHFTLKGKEFSLNLYQNQDLDRKPEYKDNLFLPFTDKTSGTTSYGGGRFIDLLLTDIQENGSIIIDFNTTYNPYCAYSGRYSCPITPKENHVNIAIKAGTMAYKKH